MQARKNIEKNITKNKSNTVIYASAAEKTYKRAVIAKL